MSERRIPKNPAIISETNGEVISITTKESSTQAGIEEKIIKVLSDSKADGKSNEIEYVTAFRRTPIVKTGDKIKMGDLLTDGSADLSQMFKFGNKVLLIVLGNVQQ